MKNIKHNYIIWSSLLLIVLVASCIDVIELETGDAEEVLIIEGFIHKDGPEVKIRKSAAFAAGPKGVELPVSGAAVTIVEIGGPSVSLSETEPGKYESTELLGTEGKSYQLKVDVDGNTYESSIEQLPAKVPITDLDWSRRQESVTNVAGNVATQDIFILESDATIPPIFQMLFCDLEYLVFMNFENEQHLAILMI